MVFCRFEFLFPEVPEEDFLLDLFFLLQSLILQHIHLEYLDPFLLCHNQILQSHERLNLLMLLLMRDSLMQPQYQIDVLLME
jgi:hypothetical protein